MATLYCVPTRLSHVCIHNAFAVIAAKARACDDGSVERAAQRCHAMFPAFVVLHGTSAVRAWLLQTTLAPPPSIVSLLHDGALATLGEAIRVSAITPDDVHQALRVWNGATDGQTRVSVLMQLLANA